MKPACDRWKAICTEAQLSLKSLCTARDKEVKALKTLEKTKVKEGSKKAQQVAVDLAAKQTEVTRRANYCLFVVCFKTNQNLILGCNIAMKPKQYLSPYLKKLEVKRTQHISTALY